MKNPRTLVVLLLWGVFYAAQIKINWKKGLRYLVDFQKLTTSERRESSVMFLMSVSRLLRKENPLSDKSATCQVKTCHFELTFLVLDQEFGSTKAEIQWRTKCFKAAAWLVFVNNTLEIFNAKSPTGLLILVCSMIPLRIVQIPQVSRMLNFFIGFDVT